MQDSIVKTPRPRLVTMAERGAAERAIAKVDREQGISWTVDQLLIDVDQSAATLEWAGFNRQHARIVRGVDWFVFEPHTLCIQEIRPYAAAPIHPDKPRQESQDFDHAGRDYPMTFPAKN